MSDEVDVLNQSNPSVSVGINNLEDFSAEFLIRSESEEESVVSDKCDELLKTESESNSVFFVFSFDNNFNEENFKNDSNKFLESSELVLFRLKLEERIKNVTDFVFIQLEDTLKNGFNFIDFED